MKTNVIIRKANVKDIESIEKLYNSIIDYLNATHNYPGWKKGIYPTREDAISGLEEDVLYVAEVNSNIAGTIMLIHKGEDGYKQAKWSVDTSYDKVYVVYTLAVNPDYLRMGVGEKLLLFAEELAMKEGCLSIRLDVVKGNIPAIHLYEKCGFKYIDTVSFGYEEYGLPLYDLFEKDLRK